VPNIVPLFPSGAGSSFALARRTPEPFAEVRTPSIPVNPFRLLPTASFAFLLLTCLEAVHADPPNILLILTDDQGYGDVSLHGNKHLSTPHLDRLAQEGLRLDRFFVSPVCAPTRAALLTGRYPTRTGVHGVTRGRETMRGTEITLAEVLQDAGYTTGAFGKWHNGAHWPNHPNAQGFDDFVGFCGGHWNTYFDPVLQRNGVPVATNGFIADTLTDEALAFLERNRDHPFFCFVPYNTPHTPAIVPPEDWERWSDREEEVPDVHARAMYALVENLDRNVGRLLTGLDRLDLADETLVVFLTDNGPNGARFNAGMRGRKGSVMEGGVRVPCFLRWPGRIPPGTIVEENHAHIDLLPTLIELAGAPHPDPSSLDGISFAPRLRGESYQAPDRHLFTWREPGRWSIRSSRYRATARTLHDLKVDPGQERNLAEDMPELHRELVAAYRAWAQDAVPEDPDPLPVQIGHPEWPRVTLRAHEWEIHPGAGQGIDYCGPNGYANQWIEDWESPEAYAEIPVTVLGAGRYRVSIRYACPPEATGSIFRLEAGNREALDLLITEPWVSEPWPAPVKAPAGHPYLSRDWKTATAGVIELEEGTYPLRLRLEKRPAPNLPDFKALILEKL